MNRYVEVLPISLDNYKYLAYEDMVFVSEYVELTSDNIEKNKISFSITKNRTMFRLYVENENILLRMTETTSNTRV